MTCVSLHLRRPGFFPGTGAAEDSGAGRGRGHTLNVPLAEGLRDGLFLEALTRVAGGAFEMTTPDFVVLCCGADGLARDPLGGWCLSPAGLAEAARVAKGWGAPLLVLGGGGYDCANAARAWAAVTAVLLEQPLPNDIPHHEYSNLYGTGGISRSMIPISVSGVRIEPAGIQLDLRSGRVHSSLSVLTLPPPPQALHIAWPEMKISPGRTKTTGIVFWRCARTFSEG